MNTPRAVQLTTVCLALLCLTAGALGVRLLATYENTAGAAGSPPKLWPSESKLESAGDRLSLVMIVHPRCPCSEASLRELAEVLTHAQGKVAARVVFAKPPGAPAGWERGRLLEQAQAIPGVRVTIDEAGEESARFAAETSGHTLLFSREGQLLFSGGITGARGHSGDNAGRESLLAWLNATAGAQASTPVFGCPLSGPTR